MTVYQKRMNLIKEYGGKIIDIYDSPRFSEYTIKRGGDVDQFRVYGDNEETMIVTVR